MSGQLLVVGDFNINFNSSNNCGADKFRAMLMLRVLISRLQRPLMTGVGLLTL